jgi:hypothetical protein
MPPMPTRRFMASAATGSSASARGRTLGTRPGDTLRVSARNKPSTGHATAMACTSSVGIRDSAIGFARSRDSRPDPPSCRRCRSGHSRIATSRRQSASRCAHGKPSPLDPPETVTAETAKAAAEQLTGATLLETGPHGKLAAMVWLKGALNPEKMPFYRR